MKIAFIDYDIDNFHANVFARLLKESDTSFHLSAVWAKRQDNIGPWAGERGVTAVERIEELRDLADVIMVLAPSNPEVHEELCEQAFALGKTTYVDKTFAPDVATARRIFECADRHQIAIQTSSILRYTEVQEACRAKPEAPVRHLSTWASGGNFDEYIIHPLEHVVSVMGAEIESVKSERMAGFQRITLGFSRDRAATIQMYVGHSTPFFSVVSNDVETRPITIDGSKLFLRGLQGILDFFRDPATAIDRRETLAVLQTIETLKG